MTGTSSGDMRASPVPPLSDQAALPGESVCWVDLTGRKPPRTGMNGALPVVTSRAEDRRDRRRAAGRSRAGGIAHAARQPCDLGAR